MDKEYLLHKWLNNELSAQEMEAFNKLEDRDALLRLAEHMKSFNAPEYDEQLELQRISKAIQMKKLPSFVRKTMTF